ncbi:MAG TPA: acyl-CoA dehydrogenase family protein [Verrucomicrobiae bacterium]|nr:acyl-CoA dehydrogenase family protein [Verrucomicrobiae bacterium]
MAKVLLALSERKRDMQNGRELEFLKEVKAFCRKHVDPFCEQWEKEESLPSEIFSVAGKLGLMGMLAPEKFGGLGLNFITYIAALREVARHFGALALNLATHNSLCIGQILKFGSAEQKERCLPRLASGEWLSAWALTEPAAGSDCGSMETTAQKKNGAWELNGRKMFITQGGRADILVVIAVTGTKSDESKELTAFLVNRDQVRSVRKIPTYGMKASDTSELGFERAKAELLGDQGQGRAQALLMLDRGRIGIAALALGIAEAAYDAARRHALKRKQFGRSISDNQAVQWMLADSATEIDAAELLITRAAEMQDQGLKTTKESAMAKLFASEAATRICNRALQIHGGYGYSRDYPLERYLRDVKLCEIAEGTSEIQRLLIARKVLKEAETEV